MFETLLGNELIKKVLNHALENHCLAHTLLFSGIDGIGKKLFAYELSAHLLKTSISRLRSGNHPDFHFLVPEGKSALHPIETIRKMIDKDHAAPFEASHKVFLIEYAERMQPASMNALLKTLEEPSLDSTFILLTSSSQEILPTILSRCSHFSFHPLQEKEMIPLLEKNGIDQRFGKLSNGSIGRALELSEDVECEEQRKILFQILSKKKSYLETMISLEKLEKIFEERKEEDPIRASKFADHFFTLIFMWARDQHLLRINARKEHLFFPEEPTTSLPLSSLEKIEASISDARLAFQRNIKFSVCLERAIRD